jgi:hypothetical protein
MQVVQLYNLYEIQHQLTSEVYVLMQTLAASLYTFSAQGRPGGLKALTYRQAMDQSGPCPLSTHFKTSKRFMFQPIPIAADSQELMDEYINFLRPTIAKNGNIAPEDNDDSPFFLTFSAKGKIFNNLLYGILLTIFYFYAALNVSQSVAAFFKRFSPYDLTCNTLRSLIETTVEDGRLEGKVSRAEQRSVQRINGHSGTTSRAYYVKHSRFADAERVTNVLERAAGGGGAAALLPRVCKLFHNPYRYMISLYSNMYDRSANMTTWRSTMQPCLLTVM